MPFYLVKTKSGLYCPYDDEDHARSSKIKVGDVIKASKPRSYQFHKKAFSLLMRGFENQEKYHNFEIYRKIVTILAGYYDEVESKRGVEYLPKSLSYENMNAEDFEDWYEAMLKVVSNDLGISVEELLNEL